MTRHGPPHPPHVHIPADSRSLGSRHTHRAPRPRQQRRHPPRARLRHPRKTPHILDHQPTRPQHPQLDASHPFAIPPHPRVHAPMIRVPRHAIVVKRHDPKSKPRVVRVVVVQEPPRPNRVPHQPRPDRPIPNDPHPVPYPRIVHQTHPRIRHAQHTTAVPELAGSSTPEPVRVTVGQAQDVDGARGARRSRRRRRSRPPGPLQGIQCRPEEHTLVVRVGDHEEKGWRRRHRPSQSESGQPKFKNRFVRFLWVF